MLAAKTRSESIALVGPPNSGKTTLFNALTGLRQKVANYPGVTVEKKEGRLKRHAGGPTIIDLPGLYSLNAHTPDEKVTREILLGESNHTPRPSAMVIVLDGSMVERSLALASSLLALGIPCAVVLTMFDEIKARGGSIDPKRLSEELGVPVIPIVGHRGIGLSELRHQIGRFDRWPTPPAPRLNGARSRFEWAKAVLGRSLHTPLREDAFTAKIDRVVLHPVAGPVIFLAVMALFFQSIFTWAQPAMDLIGEACTAAGTRVGGFLPDGFLKGLVVNGVFEGVGSVISFLPQIMILFFLLFLLEDVGYMARAAFLMDRIMGWSGLQGRSFIALVSSYACAVPGIMAARTIPSPKDRLATILVAPFMTCSARLPVYALLIGAFIPATPVVGPINLQGLTLLGLYLLGSVSALIAARIFKSSLLQGDIIPFYMELPPYRFPSLKSVGLAMLDRAKIFLKRAGRIILGVSLLVYLSMSISAPSLTETPRPAATLEESVAGRIGKALEPVFAPLGFDWRINIGLLSSLVAREVVVSTLSQIYAVETDAPLEQALVNGVDKKSGRPLMTVPAAISLMVFFVYALQCLSTIAVIRRETNSWRWPAFAFAYMFACAYAGAWLAYRAALAFWGGA